MDKSVVIGKIALTTVQIALNASFPKISLQ